MLIDHGSELKSIDNFSKTIFSYLSLKAGYYYSQNQVLIRLLKN